jgi:hypothetical protein
MLDPQNAVDVLMIRPVAFTGNPETASSNRFQDAAFTSTDLANEGASQFELVVKALESWGVRVHAFDAKADPPVPDAIFPNNWVSFHANGQVVLYPMQALNRRYERRKDLLTALVDESDFTITDVVDLSHLERDGKFLEGTGSLVLDRENRIAYACLSPRTHPDALAEFGERLGYRVISFNALDLTGFPVYHTNVVMSVGRNFAVICADAIPSAQRIKVLRSLRMTGHDPIEISLDQMTKFAGNILELQTHSAGALVALSACAEQAFNEEQRNRLRSLSGPLVSIPIPTIEGAGGGSVRCMLAEIHLPKRVGR